MSRKTQQLYEIVLAKVKELCDIEPQIVTADFEVGLQNAIKITWPASNVVGCWFHSANVSDINCKNTLNEFQFYRLIQ